MESINQNNEKLEIDLYIDSLKGYKKLSLEDKIEIINKSKDTANEVYLHFKKRNKLNLNDLFTDYGVKIFFNDSEDYGILSYYDKANNELRIYKKTIETYIEVLEANSEYSFSYEKFLDILLAHEFFHVYEMNEEKVYTFTDMYKRKVLFFEIGEKILEASEIGANEFSRLYNNMDVSLEILNNIVSLNN